MSQDDEPGEFERAGQGKPISLVSELLFFLVESRKWWMTPIFIVLGLLGLLIILGSTGAAPFIYTLF